MSSFLSEGYLFNMILKRTKVQILIQQFTTMTNHKISKKLVNFGTQFSSTDIYFQPEEHNGYREIEKVQIPMQKEEKHLLSQNQPKNSSSVSKQSKDEKKSLNHNFQKHAVVTIKKLMKMKYDANACLEEKIAHRMWNIFMVTDIKSKKLLMILFGSANLSDERNKQLFVKCGFEQIINKDQILIRKAQEILRKRFTQLVSEQVLRQNIQNFRNIRASQEFLVYFTQLLNLIRRGPLIKLRINNSSAKKIQAEIINKKTRKQSSERFQIE